MGLSTYLTWLVPAGIILGLIALIFVAYLFLVDRDIGGVIHQAYPHAEPSGEVLQFENCIYKVEWITRYVDVSVLTIDAQHMLHLVASVNQSSLPLLDCSIPQGQYRITTSKTMTGDPIFIIEASGTKLKAFIKGSSQELQNAIRGLLA